MPRLSARAVREVAQAAWNHQCLPLPLTSDAPNDPILVLVWDARGWHEPANIDAIEAWAERQEERFRANLNPSRALESTATPE